MSCVLSGDHTFCMTPMHFVWYFRKKRPGVWNKQGYILINPVSTCNQYDIHAFCMGIPAKKRVMTADYPVSRGEMSVEC